MRKILTFDLDMTLLDHSIWGIPKSASDALQLLKDNGNIVVLATGRDMSNYYSIEFMDMIKPDATIELNGAKITAAGTIVEKHLFDKKILKDLIEYAKKNKYAVGVTIGDTDYYTNPDVVTSLDIEHWGICERRFNDPDLLFNEEIMTLAYIGGPDGAHDIERRFPQLKLPLFSGNTGADIIETGVSKAIGLKTLCKYYNVDIKDTISFGDSMNDYEIIMAAGIGIAMGNSREELKHAANYVTDDIDKDGIWNACKHFNLI